MAESTTEHAQNRFASYLGEVREELGKVVWPTREHSFRMTLVVLFVVVLAMVVIFGIDAVFNQILEFLLGIGS